jgi:hypothetical protein
MSETRRWEDDERGRGVASASHLTGGVEALLAAMAEPDWVAEDADAHLLPHIESGAGETAGVVSAEVNDAGELVVDVELTGPPPEDGRFNANRRAIAFGLIGMFAETGTYVEELELDGGAEFVVVTGMLEGTTPFLPHGHTVRLRVRSSSSSSEGAGETDGS